MLESQRGCLNVLCGKRDGTYTAVMPIQTIVTHPGSSHKDDFLACCILAHLHGANIERRDPIETDLSNPEICVVDIGGSHDPSLQNFDHHQFPRDHEPLCALSLVLQDLGLYNDAQQFFPWLRPAEWLDTRGPNETAQLMGIPREAFTALMSPIDVTLLRRFASETQLSNESPIYQVMCMIGDDIVSYVRNLRQRLEELKHRCKFWTIETEQGNFQTLFLERTDPADEDPSFGIHQFIATECRDRDIVALVYPDRRGRGYGLTRYQDSPRVNFSQLEDFPDVRFAHKRGFVAKTDATDQGRLKELLRCAIVV